MGLRCCPDRHYLEVYPESQSKEPGHSFTMALLAKLDAGEVHADSQSEATLLDLSLEIRTEIYNYVYPEHLLHFMRNFNRSKPGAPAYLALW
jgi:hypothetical protein